ncbi:MAG TPA: serine protease, partial [Pirellulales bacterium]
MPKPRFVLMRLTLAGALAIAAFVSGDALAGVWPSTFAPPATRPAEVPQQPHPAVVRVIAPEEGGTSFGSGTLVDVRGDYGLVLTNWHVVADATHTVEVVFPDGFRSAARVITTDRTWDLAALAVWRPNVPPVPLATRPPQPGEPLTIAGYGSGKYRAITGKCTQYVAPALNKPYEMVELSVAARQGDSGGPIFNSQGELAGVLWGAGWGTTSG